MNAEFGDADGLFCTSSDWCFFKRPCSEIEDSIPPLVFKLGDEPNAMYYEVQSRDFMFADKMSDGTEYCHLGIIGQEKVTTDYWVLGDAFLGSFYTVFDANNENQPKIGIASEFTSLGIVKVEDKKPDYTFEILISALSLVLVVLLITACLKIRNNRLRKNAEGKVDLLNRSERLNSEGS